MSSPFLTPQAEHGSVQTMARIRLDPKVREALQALGRIGGRIGGKARAKKLTAEQRREIARKAARTRWEREKNQKK